jgi:putative hydrolase of the HAD superfamily
MTERTLTTQPELVLFDLDDTLCDYAGARARRLRRAFEQAAAHAGARLPDDLEPMIAESIAIHPHGTEHFRDVLERYGITGEGAVLAAREWYATNRFHSLALFPDAVETLTSVRRARPDRRIGMITNGPSEVQRAKIELLAIEAHVDFILVSEEFGAWKPDPSIFAEALRLGGAEPASAIFIGDSAEHDMAGARAAGIDAVWMNPAGRPWSSPPPAPRYIVSSLAEVRALLGAAVR